MGQMMASGLGSLADFTIAALVDPREPPTHEGVAWVRTIEEVDPSSADAVVDFSAPDGVAASARWCAAHAKVLVVGTTGLSEDQRDELRAAGERTGVVLCANYSIGAVLSERF